MGQEAPPKRQELFTNLCDVITHTVWIFIKTAVRNSSLGLRLCLVVLTSWFWILCGGTFFHLEFQSSILFVHKYLQQFFWCLLFAFWNISEIISELWTNKILTEQNNLRFKPDWQTATIFTKYFFVRSLKNEPLSTALYPSANRIFETNEDISIKLYPAQKINISSQILIFVYIGLL
jgi:hypothetical protein